MQDCLFLILKHSLISTLRHKKILILEALYTKKARLGNLKKNPTVCFTL